MFTIEATAAHDVSSFGTGVSPHRRAAVQKIRPTIAIFAIPLSLVLIVLLTSPNFDSKRIDRLSPWGSDFLQEWVGGQIWHSVNRNELYSPEHFKAVQHDSDLIGFSWSSNQYYPMVYPPFYYMLVSPLSMIPYSGATVIWLLGLGLVSGATLYCFCNYFEPARAHGGKCLIGLIAFCPFLTSLNMAHKSILLLFILTVTWLLLYHRKPFLSGLAFGLIAFKPHLGILIGLAMLYKRQWRFVAGCLGTVSMLVAASLIAGPELCRDYFWQSLEFGNYSDNGGYSLTESHNLAGAMELTFGRSPIATAISTSLTVIVLILLAIVLRGPLNFRSSRFALQFSMLVIATILTSPHFYFYDLTILLLPIALILLMVGSAFSSSPGFPETEGPLALESAQQRLQMALCVSLFVVAGLSTTIAERFGFQPILLILLLMLVSLTSQLLKTVAIGTAKQIGPLRPISNAWPNQRGRRIKGPL